MKGLFQCPPRAAPWVTHKQGSRPVRAKALKKRSFCPYKATLFYIEMLIMPMLSFPYVPRLRLPRNRRASRTPE